MLVVSTVSLETARVKKTFLEKKIESHKENLTRAAVCCL